MTVTAAALAAHPFTADLPEPDLAALAAGAEPVHLPAGQVVFREGDPAERFYLLQSGRVGLEVHATGRPAHLLTTLGAGDLLGASWLFPPYQWQFEAVVLDEVEALALDAATVRAACEADDGLGRRLVERVAAVLVKRLQAARLRLLDLYGDGGGDA